MYLNACISDAHTNKGIILEISSGFEIFIDLHCMLSVCPTAGVLLRPSPGCCGDVNRQTAHNSHTLSVHR